MRSAYLILCVVMLPVRAFAAQKPPEIITAIRAQTPLGEAALNKWFWHIYNASFWSDSGGWNAPPYALTVTYGMHFTAAQLADRSYEEMKRVSSLPNNKLMFYTEKLRAIFHDVQAGDRITALALPNDVTVFYYNGPESGRMKDNDFAAAFFGIWLSPRSSEPTLQEALTHSF